MKTPLLLFAIILIICGCSSEQNKSQNDHTKTYYIELTDGFVHYSDTNYEFNRDIQFGDDIALICRLVEKNSHRDDSLCNTKSLEREAQERCQDMPFKKTALIWHSRTGTIEYNTSYTMTLLTTKPSKEPDNRLRLNNYTYKLKLKFNCT